MWNGSCLQLMIALRKSSDVYPSLILALNCLRTLSFSRWRDGDPGRAFSVLNRSMKYLHESAKLDLYIIFPFFPLLVLSTPAFPSRFPCVSSVDSMGL